MFRAPATAFDALESGGVDVVSVANNHGMDFGETGLRDTLASAKRAGMPIVGAGRNDTRAYAPFRRTIRGQRLAIIGATQVLDDHLVSAWSAGPGKLGLASAKDEPRLVRAVREARSSSDTVVVFLHWGLELDSCPTSSQKSLARKLVAAGADIVVGSHAHVLVGAGRRGKALVAYGLGELRLLRLACGDGRVGSARDHRHGSPDRRVPLGSRANLGRHPVSADGQRAGPGAGELARAALVHRSAALGPARRTQEFSVRG